MRKFGLKFIFILLTPHQISFPWAPHTHSNNTKRFINFWRHHRTCIHDDVASQSQPLSLSPFFLLALPPEFCIWIAWKRAKNKKEERKKKERGKNILRLNHKKERVFFMITTMQEEWIFESYATVLCAKKKGN